MSLSAVSSEFYDLVILDLSNSSRETTRKEVHDEERGKD